MRKVGYLFYRSLYLIAIIVFIKYLLFTVDRNLGIYSCDKSVANNIEMQYNSRKEMFPGVDITFKVDIVGQAYTQEMIDEILNLVEQQTGINGLVQFIFD